MVFSPNILSSIQNGQLNKKLFIYQKKTKLCKLFLTFLWKNNLILGYFSIKNKKYQIFLKYIKNKPVIKNIKLVSKSNRKVYLSIKQIWKIKITNKIILISTNKGLKSLIECKKENIAGELIAIIS